MMRIAIALVFALLSSAALAQNGLPGGPGAQIPNGGTGGGGGPPTGAAGGDLSGTYPNPSVAKINGVSPAPSATTDTTNASNISTGTLAAARGGAGTITGALKGNGAGVVTQAACGDLSNSAASCSTDATNAANIGSGTLPNGRMPAHTGDCTSTAGTVALTCTKTNGTSFSPSATTDATNASNISAGTLAAARGGAGTITGALKGNGAGVVTQAACGDLSNAAASCSTDTTNASNISSGTLAGSHMPALTGDCTTTAGAVATTCTKTNGTAFGGYATISAGAGTNSLASDVNLNNTSTYFDGPSVTTTGTGTWFASGIVTLVDSTNSPGYLCKLWDGTTIMASAAVTAPTTNVPITVTLSGIISPPQGNIRISCADTSSVNGKMRANISGNGKDSTVSAYRVN